MGRFIYSILLFNFFIYHVSAQSYNPQRTREKIENIYHEKLKPADSPENIYGNSGDRNEQSQNSELIVSGNKSEIESEIHAAINPVDSNNMVASSNKISNTNNTLNFIYYTKDFGASWEKSGFIPSPITQGAINIGGGDPVFVYDKNGRVYFSWISLNGTLIAGGEWALYWAYSDDGGETWNRNASQPYIAVSKTVGFNLPNQLFDKQWMACDRSNGPYANTVYCAFFEASNLMQSFMIGVRKKEESSDQFTSASVPVSGSDFADLQYCSIDVDSKGVVHILFFGTKDDSHWGLYYSQSADGGASFTPNVKISNVHNPRYSGDEPNCKITGIDSARFYPCPHIVADKSGGTADGNLYAVWTANGIQINEGKGLDIYFSRSTDNGGAWSTAMVVNDNTDNLSSDQFYPTIEVKNDGGIAVFYYDRRNDTANKLTDIYGSYSFDGGISFKPAIKVTNQPSDFSKIGTKNNNFGIGEYIQVITSPSFAIPFWADGRTNDGEINIYAALVPMEKRIEAPLISYIKVNPVPAADFFNIDVSSTENDRINFTIYDVTAKLIFKSVSQDVLKGETTVRIDARSFSNGTYLVVVNSERQGKAIKKVMVTK